MSPSQRDAGNNGGLSQIAENELLEYTRSGDVALLSIDDGKANAVGFAFIDALNGALDRPVSEAKAEDKKHKPPVGESGCVSRDCAAKRKPVLSCRRMWHHANG
jgi:hypothetical protein